MKRLTLALIFFLACSRETPITETKTDGELQSRAAVHPERDAMVRREASAAGNPSSSALATEDEPVYGRRSGSPKREPVTADSKGQPRADEASRPLSFAQIEATEIPLPRSGRAPGTGREQPCTPDEISELRRFVQGVRTAVANGEGYASWIPFYERLTAEPDCHVYRAWRASTTGWFPEYVYIAGYDSPARECEYETTFTVTNTVPAGVTVEGLALALKHVGSNASAEALYAELVTCPRCWPFYEVFSPLTPDDRELVMAPEGWTGEGSFRKRFKYACLHHPDFQVEAAVTWGGTLKVAD